MRLDAADRQMIDSYQRNLPVCERPPYEEMARALDLTEEEVIQRLSALQEQQVLSRVGPVFEHSQAGASCWLPWPRQKNRWIWWRPGSTVPPQA